MMNVEGKTWMRQQEMVAELEDMNYEVIELGNFRVAIVDLMDDDETAYNLTVSYVNHRMQITSVEYFAA